VSVGSTNVIRSVMLSTRGLNRFVIMSAASYDNCSCGCFVLLYQLTRIFHRLLISVESSVALILLKENSRSALGIESSGVVWIVSPGRLVEFRFCWDWDRSSCWDED